MVLFAGIQVKLCDPRLSALSVVATIKALYRPNYTSFLSFPLSKLVFNGVIRDGRGERKEVEGRCLEGGRERPPQLN